MPNERRVFPAENARGRTVLVITNAPNHYRVPLFNELNRQLSERGMRLHVVFGARESPRRLTRAGLSACVFAYTILPGRALPGGDFEKIRLPFTGLNDVIGRERPGVIVSAGFSPATSRLWWRSLFRESPYVIWSGALPNPRQPETFSGRLYRRMLLRRAASSVAYGSEARNYLLALGAAPDSVEIAINTVDIRPFLSVDRNPSPEAGAGRPAGRILSVGYLTPRKRMDQVLQTARALARRRSDFTVKIVGDGPEMKNLVAMSGELGLEDLVRFEGFRDPGEIPGYLAEADVFLYPTDFDIWGHVLVEAMAAGVPSVASLHSGAARELVSEGRTGFRMDFVETERVAEKVDWLLRNPGEAGNIGARSRDFAGGELTLEKSASGIVRAIEKVLPVAAGSEASAP